MVGKDHHFVVLLGIVIICDSTHCISLTVVFNLVSHIKQTFEKDLRSELLAVVPMTHRHTKAVQCS